MNPVEGEEKEEAGEEERDEEAQEATTREGEQSEMVVEEKEDCIRCSSLQIREDETEK